MSIPLTSLSRCFQGLIASTITTCSPDGWPNVTTLSQVHYVDPRHVALSCQFFNKTRRNVEKNPAAVVETYDPKTLDAYRLHLRYVRSETSGPLFDTMALRIQAIASVTGMSGIFRLLSADVYEVQSIEAITSQVRPHVGPPPPSSVGAGPNGPYHQVLGVQIISQEINRAASLEQLLENVLKSLEAIFGFAHSCVLVPDGSGERLVALAAHGYGEEGIGAEVQLGEGIIGAVAQQKRLLRVSHVEAELRYGRAVRQRVESAVGPSVLRPEIPLPGLEDAQSQLALPLLVQDRLVGVLSLEDREALAFDDWDEALLQILANQIAIGIDKLGTREEDEAPGAASATAKPGPGKVSSTSRRTFTLFKNDDCIFVDGEYLIRNVPALILWKLLSSHRREGRTEFSNRELRLDPSLKLPELRDNLESRLILLRKRLAQQCPDVKLVPVRRGRFALELKCRVELVEKDSSAAPS